MYVYRDTLIGFLMLTNHWCLLSLSTGSLWNDMCSHSFLSLPSSLASHAATESYLHASHQQSLEFSSNNPSTAQHKLCNHLLMTFILLQQFKYMDSCYNSPSYMIPAFYTEQQSAGAYKPPSSLLVLHAAIWSILINAHLWPPSPAYDIMVGRVYCACATQVEGKGGATTPPDQSRVQKVQLTTRWNDNLEYKTPSTTAKLCSLTTRQP